jgi:hypothetical protein
MNDSVLASVCKEAFVAKFKEVSLHLYDVTEQDNGRSVWGESVYNQKDFQKSS